LFERGGQVTDADLNNGNVERRNVLLVRQGLDSGEDFERLGPLGGQRIGSAEQRQE
jgi:hypothetical protein